MPTDRDALAAWLAAVLRAELPLREGPYALTPCPREGGAEREITWSGAAWCDGRHVGVRLRVRGPSAAETFRELALVPVERCADRARAESFVRAWCAVLRRSLHDLATSDLPGAPTFTAAELGTNALFASLLSREALAAREDFVAALSERKHFGRFYAIPAAVAEAALERVHAVLTERPPLLKNSAFTLQALTTPWNDDPPPGPSRGGIRVQYSGVVVALDLALLDDSGVRDSKQQEIEMAPAEFLGDLGRVEAYLRAWRDALAEHAGLIPPDEVPFTMPHDMVCPALLATRRARTRDDFALAFARRWQFPERRALRQRQPKAARR